MVSCFLSSLYTKYETSEFISNISSSNIKDYYYHHCLPIIYFVPNDTFNLSSYETIQVLNYVCNANSTEKNIVTDPGVLNWRADIWVVSCGIIELYGTEFGSACDII